MPDEANSHYFALIDQLIEGHQWLERNLGESGLRNGVCPHSWAQEAAGACGAQIGGGWGGCSLSRPIPPAWAWRDDKKGARFPGPGSPPVAPVSSQVQPHALAGQWTPLATAPPSPTCCAVPT